MHQRQVLATTCEEPCSTLHRNGAISGSVVRPVRLKHKLDLPGLIDFRRNQHNKTQIDESELLWFQQDLILALTTMK
jgi:hypothetical protein